MDKEDSAEIKIKIAAEKIFMERGFDGARMQDIADEAGVNKAMLNYYFRSKKALFEMIFFEKIGLLFGNLVQIMISSLPFEEKVKRFVDEEISILMKYPLLPIFVVNEMHKNPNLLKEKVNFIQFDQVIGGVRSQIEDEIEKGNIRNIPSEHILVDMISLCIFPFLAKPVIQFVLNKDDKAFLEMLEKRKSHVSAFLLHYLNPKS